MPQEFPPAHVPAQVRLPLWEVKVLAQNSQQTLSAQQAHDGDERPANKSCISRKGQVGTAARKARCSLEERRSACRRNLER